MRDYHYFFSLLWWRNESMARLSNGDLVSGPSDARHLLHATSRLVRGTLGRAGTGICLAWASGHADGMSGGRRCGRRLWLPICPAIRLHLNLVPKPREMERNWEIRERLVYVHYCFNIWGQKWTLSFSKVPLDGPNERKDFFTFQI